MVLIAAGAVRAATRAPAPPDPAAPAAAAAANPNCTLVVPPDPLSAKGLATPYRLRATDRGKGACHEANPAQSAFVQATVVDPATGMLAVYDPLVVEIGRAHV